MRARPRWPRHRRGLLALGLALGAFLVVAASAGPAESEAAETTTETTDTADEVVVASWVVWVDRFDHVVVQHDLQVENRGQRTWVGHSPDADGERAVVTVPVPPGGTGLETLGYFEECCATFRGGDFVHTTPLPPGEVTGTLRYHIERLDVLELPLELPVETLTVLTPDGVSLEHDRFEQTGRTESQGRVYEVHTTEDLARGEVLELRFRGLALQGVSPLLFAVAAGAAVVVAGGALAWARSRRARAGAPTGEDAHPRGLAAGVTETDLMDEIALLDIGYERELLDPDEYAVLRRARRRELVGAAAEGEAQAGAAALRELALLDLGLRRGLIAPETFERLRRARRAEAGELETTKG